MKEATKRAASGARADDGGYGNDRHRRHSALLAVTVRRYVSGSRHCGERSHEAIHSYYVVRGKMDCFASPGERLPSSTRLLEIRH